MPKQLEKLKESYVVKKLRYWLTETPANNPAVSLPFFKALVGPFNSFADNFRNVVFLTLPYALVLMLLALAFGYGQMCYFDASFFYCSNSGFLYGIYQLVKLVILTFFVVAYYNNVYLGAPFRLWVLDKRVVKVFFLNVASIILCLMPVLSFYLLMQRVPNPNWKLELTYFGVVSIGFLMPFIAIRLYAWLAFAASGETLPSIGLLWRKNSGNMLKLILGFFLIALVMVFLGSSLINYYNYNNNTIWDALSFEFLIDVLVLTFWVLICDNAEFQKNYLFQKEVNDEEIGE